jgi:inorganic phosphate transporter, PiT family
MSFFLIFIIFLALAFDYINGFHDAANSIATVVSTRVLTPFQAVLWAAAFNFAAFFIFKDHGVANTIAKTVQEDYVTLTVITGGLLAAIVWNLLTWWFGIPSSSSHTLIGGLMGSAIAHAGFQSLNPEPIIKTASFILLAPMVGMLMAFLVSLWFLHSFVKKLYPKLITIAILVGVGLLVYSQLETNPDKLKGLPYDSMVAKTILYGKNFKWFLLSFIVLVIGVFTLFLSGMVPAQAERWFKRMQLVSSAAFSIGHGGNDAQKVMGIIMAALIAYDPLVYSLDKMEWWVPLACYGAIAAGTMSGGWKIIKTMGSKITKVTPFEGVAAETAGAITLFITENLKIPVSTTHTITGAIVGVGATKRLSAVRWGVTYSLVFAWILTIPVSAAMGMLFFYLLKLFGAP